MQVEMRPVDSIKPYPGNPRVNENAVPAVARSIKEFGFRNPILVDAEGCIVAGHTRHLAAKSLGLAEVPVVTIGDLTPEQVRAFRIADNQTASLATWDENLLPLELGALQEADFDLGLLGFSEEYLARLLAPEGEEGATDADAVPETPADPVSKPGEIYRLGRHRLLCGDSTKAEDVARLMAGEKADLLLTDPPYAVAYVGATKDELMIENDDMPPEEFAAFLTAAFQAADAVMKPGAGFYIWYADRSTMMFRRACEAAGWQIRQGLVWAKNILVMGRCDYHYRHEPCMYGWKDGAAHQWFSDRKQTTVLEFDKPARSADHPTMKPVELFAYQLANSCPPGGLVLDPFGGSGTTLIAAERHGMRACSLELSPQYADVIRRRWAEFVHGENCD